MEFSSKGKYVLLPWDVFKIFEDKFECGEMIFCFDYTLFYLLEKLVLYPLFYLNYVETTCNLT